MDWLVFLLGAVSGSALTGAAWVLWWVNRPEPRLEFHRIEPERDVTVVTTEGRPRHRARSTEAHISQPRDYWNGYKPTS